jgi:hypothetical protein
MVSPDRIAQPRMPVDQNSRHHLPGRTGSPSNERQASAADSEFMTAPWVRPLLLVIAFWLLVAAGLLVTAS